VAHGLVTRWFKFEGSWLDTVGGPVSIVTGWTWGSVQPVLNVGERGIHGPPPELLICACEPRRLVAELAPELQPNRWALSVSGSHARIEEGGRGGSKSRGE
jgi:hypothetical protein